MFSEDQLYILYSTEYAGYQFGSYIVSVAKIFSTYVNACLKLQYHSFQEFLSIMQQVSVSLAVAEMVSIWDLICEREPIRMKEILSR